MAGGGGVSGVGSSGGRNAGKRLAVSHGACIRRGKLCWGRGVLVVSGVR